MTAFLLFLTLHQATLYYQSAVCTNSSPCQLDVYRAVCPKASTCPSYGNGHGWSRLTSGAAMATPTPTGTTWIVRDSDPVLQDSTTYVYVATLAWIGSNRRSQPGPPWSGTTSSGATPNTPAAPTLGIGNSVN